MTRRRTKPAEKQLKIDGVVLLRDRLAFSTGEVAQLLGIGLGAALGIMHGRGRRLGPLKRSHWRIERGRLLAYLRGEP